MCSGDSNGGATILNRGGDLSTFVDCADAGALKKSIVKTTKAVSSVRAE